MGATFDHTRDALRVIANVYEDLRKQEDLRVTILLLPWAYLLYLE